LTDSDRNGAAEPPAGEPSEVVAAPAGLEAPEPDSTATTADIEAADSDNPPLGPFKKVKKKRDKGHWFDDFKAILWLLLAVLAFHSCVAKPFYIPSESMMPGLLKGDRLVVSKYPYGWSWVSPSFHIFPNWQGRIWGAMPERGDVVIVTPPGQSSDYIKRVIGIPGDTIELVDGHVILNGRPLPREARPPAMIPIDDNVTCGDPVHDPDTMRFRVTGSDGRRYCRLPVFREFIPASDGYRSYDIADTGSNAMADEYPLHRVPDGHVFLMGDNRDHSADSRFSLDQQGLGGPVPWENIGGRAEFITFSLDGSSSYWNPISWFTALRGGRAGTSLHPVSGPPRPGPPQVPPRP